MILFSILTLFALPSSRLARAVLLSPSQNGTASALDIPASLFPFPASDTTSPLDRRGAIHFVGANEFHNLQRMVIASSVFPIHHSSRYIISIQSTVPTLQVRVVASPDLATVADYQLQDWLAHPDFDNGQGGWLAKSWATRSDAVTRIFVPTSDTRGTVLVEFLDFWASGWIAVWSEEK